MNLPMDPSKRAVVGRTWYERDAAGQRRIVGEANLPVPGASIPVLQIADLGPPQAITLQLDREILALPPGAANAGVRARITWGCGGARDTLIADWCDGGQFQLVAQSLEVDALCYQPYPLGIFGWSGYQLAVSAAVGHGQASTIHPFLTERIPAIAPGASTAALFPPAFARAVSVFPSYDSDIVAAANDPYTACRVDIVTRGALPVARIRGEYLAAGAAAPLPDTCYVQVVADAGAPADIRPTIVWHLSC